MIEFGPEDGDLDSSTIAFEHAAGVLWTAARGMMLAYAADPEMPKPDGGIAQIARIPEWENLAECPSTGFAVEVVTPLLSILTKAVLASTRHHYAVHGDE